MIIQGFNRDEQRALGKVKLEVVIDGIESNALFHVIDAKTTYNMLLGRPWINQNGMVFSTLHQCFKYCRNGEVKTVTVDAKPFTMAEALSRPDPEGRHVAKRGLEWVLVSRKPFKTS